MFTEFINLSNFMPRDFFCDIVPHSQTYEGNKPLHMNYRDGIASSLIEEL
jgi:hypothetical protein